MVYCNLLSAMEIKVFDENFDHCKTRNSKRYKGLSLCLKVNQCRFENLLIYSNSYKNDTL